MKVSEFRIGNYLHDNKDRLCRVEKLEKDENFYAPAILGAITNLPNKPIKITHEILIALGFEHEYDLKYSNDQVTLEFYNGGYSVMVEERSNFNVKYNYVHEIQNLFYILIGEELTLKHTI